MQSDRAAHTVVKLPTLLFFERTTLVECVSINIVEKYKDITLGGHKQEKEKKHNNNTGGLDWDINTRRILQSNNLGWSDWDVNVSHTTCLH